MADDDTKTKDNWDKARIVLNACGVIAVPVVLGIGANLIQASLKRAEVGARFVEIAVDILRQPPEATAPPLRPWATDLIDAYSDVPLPAAAREMLLRSSLDITINFNINPDFRTRSDTEIWQNLPPEPDTEEESVAAIQPIAALSFLPNSDELYPTSQQALQRAATDLIQKEAIFSIDAFVDRKSDARAENMKVAERRTERVRTILMSLGVSSAKSAPSRIFDRPPSVPGADLVLTPKGRAR